MVGRMRWLIFVTVVRRWEKVWMTCRWTVQFIWSKVSFDQLNVFRICWCKAGFVYASLIEDLRLVVMVLSFICNWSEFADNLGTFVLWRLYWNWYSLAYASASQFIWDKRSNLSYGVFLSWCPATHLNVIWNGRRRICVTICSMISQSEVVVWVG